MQAESPSGRKDSFSSTGEHFRLTGPTLPLDARTNAWRRDLADIALAGQVIAPHYARPLIRICGAKPVMVHAAPGNSSETDESAKALTELLPGEEFAVLEYAGGWAWGYCCPDHLVGYVEAIELTAPIPPTHIVCEKFAPITADDRITSPVLAGFPMGSLLHGEEQGACLTTESGCVPLSHLRRIGEFDTDPVAVAERLLGAPFLQGGRSYHGIDPGGLIHLALSMCGIPVPRHLKGQIALGDPVPAGKPLKRGDLIFFDGGAALMIDDQMLIHASEPDRRVAVESILALSGRADILARRRLTA